jgi:hypothetical protein
MKVLVSAWQEYDITMYLANWYKAVSWFLYLLLLIVGTLIAACSFLLYEAKLRSASEAHKSMLRTVLFILPLFSSVLLALWSYVNPTTRWRKLRNSACKLQSMIFKYRTRTAPFSNSKSISKGPNLCEKRFCDELNAWREDCVAGTDLSSTDFEKKYPKRIFKHWQKDGPEVLPAFTPIEGREVETDDFHSPLTPESYIDLRLKVSYDFYKNRLPMYSRKKDILQYLSILLSACGSLLVFLDASEYVVIVSSVAGALTSWAEFRDVSRKLERYNNTLRSIKKLLSFWDSLDKVDKNSSARITQLVENGEAIISSETGSWSSWNATASIDESARQAAEANAGQTDVLSGKNAKVSDAPKVNPMRLTLTQRAS